jgi:hypothetical protein
MSSPVAVLELGHLPHSGHQHIDHPVQEDLVRQVDAGLIGVVGDTLRRTMARGEGVSALRGAAAGSRRHIETYFCLRPHGAHRQFAVVSREELRTVDGSSRTALVWRRGFESRHGLAYELARDSTRGSPGASTYQSREADRNTNHRRQR